MFNYLIEIPGPLFLIYFATYSLIVIYTIFFQLKNDNTRALEIPEPTKLSPLDIAVFKRGVNGALMCSIFNLWRKKAIIIDVDKMAISSIHLHTSDLNVVEESIYKSVYQPKLLPHLLNKSSVKMFEKLVVPNKIKLEELRLIPNAEIKNRYFLGFIIGVLLIAGVGGVKLYYGLSNNKPSMFLLVSMVLFVVWLYVQIRPNKVSVTNLGIRFMKRCEERFSWLMESKNQMDLLEDENLLYGVAIFGMQAFMKTDLGELLKEPAALDKRLMPTTTVFGGFGCSGCSGGCSSGCSGGCSGGCGGGCGGCGGD